MIGGVVLDAYGTLFNVHAPVSALAGEIGPDAAALSDLWRRKQLEYAWLRTLMGAHRDFWQITRDALDHALEAHRRADPGLRQRLLDLYFRLDAYPDARPALEALKARGLTTAILSNGSPDMLNAAARSSALTPLLDHVLSIEAAGVYKPHPAAYRLATDALGLPAERIAFVSSNGWDVAGAAHFGFTAYHINRAALPPDRLPGMPKAVIASLSDLAAKLPS
jgi:2-haloacid dehalogenase